LRFNEREATRVDLAPERVFSATPGRLRLCGGRSHRYQVAMFGALGRFLAGEIDSRVLVRAVAVAIVLAAAAIIAFLSYGSRYRDDLEIATSVLVIGVLVYGIYSALNAEAPDRAD